MTRRLKYLILSVLISLAMWGALIAAVIWFWKFVSVYM